jgi:hypothetical protein
VLLFFFFAVDSQQSRPPEKDVLGLNAENVSKNRQPQFLWPIAIS